MTERCTCGHQQAQHVSVHRGGIRAALFGLCTVPECRCRRYEPAAAERERPPPERP
jgi:hypothetical protein